jgi:hypothetical protein
MHVTAARASWTHIAVMKKSIALAVMLFGTLPLFAQAHQADGKVVLNNATTTRLAHAYGYVHEVKDEEANVTVVFTDKPIPEGWDLHQFETTAPAGVVALTLRMNGSDAERATLYAPSGTFVLEAPKMGMMWSQMGETIEGRVFVGPTTLEDGASTLSFNVKFELEVE